jgi:hypothetical protein
VLVLGTLGAPERRRWRDRRGREVSDAGAEPVPTTRATVVRPEPFVSRAEADAWLEGARAAGGGEEITAAVARLNAALHAWRAAAADPYVADVTLERALVARLGFGHGEAVADGRYAEAWELPRPGARRTRRSMEAPEEGFAAILGGHDRPPAAAELVLRARADLDAGRPREAALQARVALESLLAELEPRALGDLETARPAVSEAAGLALDGDLPDAAAAGVADAVGRMEAALRRARLGA